MKLVEVSPNWTDSYQGENPLKEETGKKKKEEETGWYLGVLFYDNTE